MSATITITLPDGSQRPFPVGVSPWEVAAAIGPRLRRDAIAAKVDGRVVDAYLPIEKDARLEIVTPDHPDALEVLRHTASHVLAQAVKELFPEARVAGGPATEDGFYYDFDVPLPFSEQDLARLEERMGEIAARDLDIRRQEMPRAEAVAHFERENEPYKVWFAREKGGEVVSTYTQKGFTDFCLGPHLPSTGRVRTFKLLSTGGAYWLGSEKNRMLQRIYGTAFWRPADLEAHLRNLEEARRRDHRRLGRELDLFSVHEELGAGLIYWHPKGAQLRLVVEDYWRQMHARAGYSFVQIPHIARDHLWKTSGHYDYYRDNMYTLRIDEDEYVLKPMNCPGHISIYRTRRHSYRELPVRYCELGTVYRYERSGTLHGMLRVRGFTQDDAHIFCTPEQITGEIAGVLDLVHEVMATFGFTEFEVELSVRDPSTPEKYAGTDADWTSAEAALEQVLTDRRMTVRRMPGEAVFYGPKIDVKLIDALGRRWQASTVQFDFNLPRRFDVRYTGADGAEHLAVMVHRALFGSLERFIGTLIEHYGGAFPLWLAPVQAVFVPITDRALDTCRAWADRLRRDGLRVEVDDRSETMAYKIREAQLQKIPLMLVVGDREVKDGVIAVRSRDAGDLGAAAPEALAARLGELTRERRLELDLKGVCSGAPARA